ncbi:MAG: DUF3108 domain-containing protein [Gemmatimonadetes bacterium]|nr:DUF3108 domain-containing protein [Gemmatimonadota bacterium]
MRSTRAAAPRGAAALRRMLVAALAVAALAWPLASAAAQPAARTAPQAAASAAPRVYPAASTAAPAPFGPGERLVYKVKIGIFNAGEGQMSIPSLDTLRGRDAYRISMTIRGGLGPARVNDAYSSWLDIRSLQSWRFIQDIHEVNYKSFRHYEFYPERRLWDREDNDESGPLASLTPLDDIAFIYFIRTLPLEVGKTYTFDRYFKVEGNPVTVNVLRRDHRKTEAGEFSTLVVQPIIRTKGLFSQGGKAEIHFTDDARRIPVYVKSDIPNFPGSLTLHLREIHEGVPLHPGARSASRP